MGHHENTENSETIQDQIAREGSMIFGGIVRHSDRQSKQKQLAKSTTHHNYIEDALEKVSDGIKGYLAVENAKGAGKPYRWVEVLNDIDPDILAYVGLTCFMGAVGEKATLTTCTALIAKRVELEVWSASLRGYDKKLATNVERIAIKEHSTERKRLEAVKAMVAKVSAKSGKRFTPQNLEVSIKTCAEPVVNAVLEFSDLFEIYVEFASNLTKKFVGFTPEAALAIRLDDAEASWKEPMFAPMICPPTPWTGVNQGGYLDRTLSSLVPLVRSGSFEQKEHIRHDFKKSKQEGGVPPYVEALNALQAVPLKINKAVLALVEHCWDNSVTFKKFPQQFPIDMPASPTQEEWDAMDTPEKSRVTTQRKATKAKNREIDGRAALMFQDLYTANDLKDFSEIYLVWNMCFRGRFYPVSNFSYHRDDHIKAMFMLANGSELTLDNCAWLAIHLANTGDFSKISKASLEDRVLWVEYNEEMIRKVAQDPVAMLETIKLADKPFQFYAACVEWLNFLEHGDGYVCCLPPALDGTNSGCQHYSALSRNEVDGALVNLIPTDKPNDVYQTVADVVNTKLKKLSAAIVSKDSAKKDKSRIDSAKLWLNYGVTRSEVKRNAMTFAYASNQYGFADQITQDLMKPLADVELVGGNPHPFGDTESQFYATKLFAEVSYSSVSEVIASAAQGMEFIQSVAVALSKENKPTMWRSPVDFPVVQKYTKWNTKKVRLYLYDREAKVKKRGQMSIRREDKFKICSAKTKAAAAANYIHSLDSAHLASTVLSLVDAGIKDFMVIHDSFSVPCGQSWQLFDIVRATFVEQYSGSCLYEDLKTTAEQQLNEPDLAEFAPIPTKGNLSLKEIMDSDYCFS